MGWSGGGSILDVAEKEFKKLFPDLLKNKKALRSLVKFKDVLEDQDYDCFYEDYNANPKLWDAALRAAGKSKEADDMMDYHNGEGDYADDEE